MKRAWLAAIAAALMWTSAHAQVPELGRWQELDYSASEVHLRASYQYQDALLELSNAGRLDDDAAILKRVENVTASLLRAAKTMKPESAKWQWEVHTTSDPETDAISMAGGKLLIGSRFVRRLDLDDAELATLIGHEMAHALADHHREMLSSVRRINPLPNSSIDVVMSQLEADWSLQLRLSQLSHLQESEADQIGMMLTHRAGWPAAGMVSFYRKLAAIETPSAISASHPSAASRLSMAKGMARLFGN